jgi:pyruvate dehydrogenase (quinone)
MWTTSQDVESIDYAGWARLLGFNGVTVTKDDDIGDVWDAAFAYPGVTVIDAHTGRNVPPLPPHITFEFAKNTAEALLKGDPLSLGAIKDSAKSVFVQGKERVKDALHLGDRGRDDDS